LLPLLIVTMPLIASPPMAARLFDVSGLKLPNVLAVLSFFAFMNNGLTWKVTDRLQKGALIAFGGYITLFTVNFLRSLPNVERFHGLLPESFQAGQMEYWQSYYVLPMLLAFSFFYILQRMCSRDGLQATISAISLGLFILSCTIIILMMSHPAVIMDTDPMRGAVNALVESSLGMHYNGVSTIYIITTPLLLYMALKRGSFWVLNLLLALGAVLLLKSRTGIFTCAAMGVLTLIVLGQTKTLFALAPLIAGVAIAVMGKVLIGLLSIGITQSGISTYALLSGREQAIWLPLIAEWTTDPYRFWMGAGLFGVLSSNFLFSARSIFGAGEAHNFYLEFFLDNGIVVFSLFMCVLVWWLTWSYKLGRQLRTELYWVFFLCVASFLISGFTGRRYFPEPENLLMFPILAAFINVARLRLRSLEHGQPPHTAPKASPAQAAPTAEAHA
jgi:hypothetical protein